jgi:hypothetical protein
VNAQVDPLQRRKSQVIAAFFGINLVLGAMLVANYPALMHPESAQAAMDAFRGSPLYFAYELALLVICFTWLHLDARQLDIRRPWWLNIGIAVFTVVFVPYYLFKTRPPGERRRVFLNLVGIVAGSMVSMMIGTFIAMAVNGTMASVPAT